MQFITPTDKTPITKDSWQDVDCSSIIPDGSTGVILHVYNETSGYASICDIRKKGSTDSLSTYLSETCHSWLCVGVDANRKFQAYVGDYAKIKVVGYFGDEAVFFDNVINKGLASTGSWQDISIASDTGDDTAIGAIFIIPDYASWGSFGLRKKGSTDDRKAYYPRSVSGFIVGVDNDEKLQGYIDDTDVDFFLIGYIKDGAVFNTNATDVSIGSTDSWSDLPSLPEGAIGAFIEVISGTDTYNFGLRDNDSSEDIYLSVNDGKRSFGIVGCDANGVIEGKIQNTSVDFFLIGYFVNITPEPPENERKSEISGILPFPTNDRGIKLAKDGKTIESTNPDDYNLWTKYPPLTFLEKKTVQIEIDTTDGCPEVGTLTEIVPHDYDFFPFVIARVEQDGIEERYDMPVSDFPIFGAFCDGDHGLRFSFDYEIKDDSIEINYSAYCQGLVMGEENECISSTLTFNIYLYFYMWELGSAWPV